MKIIPLLFAALGCPPLACAFGMNETPTVFPVLDKTATSLSLIVADVTISGGVKLPKIKGCYTSDTWTPLMETVSVHPCTDQQPYAFRVANVVPLHGAALPSSLYIATTGAQGLRNFNQGNRLNLLAVISDGRHAVMPRHAIGRLWTDKAGQQFLVIDGKRPPAFLPCSVATLMEEFRHDTIDTGPYGSWGLPYPEHRDDAVERVQFNGAWVPKYGISLARLKAHLAGLKPDIASIACELPRK
jgi:hypothetical protein